MFRGNRFHGVEMVRYFLNRSQNSTCKSKIIDWIAISKKNTSVLQSIHYGNGRQVGVEESFEQYIQLTKGVNLACEKANSSHKRKTIDKKQGKCHDQTVYKRKIKMDNRFLRCSLLLFIMKVPTENIHCCTRTRINKFKKIESIKT